MSPKMIDVDRRTFVIVDVAVVAGPLKTVAKIIGNKEGNRR
jgi:hypothetical protein